MKQHSVCSLASLFSDNGIVNRELLGVGVLADSCWGFESLIHEVVSLIMTSWDEAVVLGFEHRCKPASFTLQLQGDRMHTCGGGVAVLNERPRACPLPTVQMCAECVRIRTMANSLAAVCGGSAAAAGAQGA